MREELYRKVEDYSANLQEQDLRTAEETSSFEVDKVRRTILASPIFIHRQSLPITWSTNVVSY